MSDMRVYVVAVFNSWLTYQDPHGVVDRHDCCIDRDIVNEKSLFMEDICNCIKK